MKYKLSDLLETITDYHANGSYQTLKKKVFLQDQEDYALMVRTTNFENNDFSQSLKFINKDAYEFLNKSKVFPGDILMNKIATPGSVYLMPNLDRPVSLAMNLFLLRINKQKANPVYVYIYLKLNERYVKSFAQGSVTQTITKKAVRDLIVELPKRELQDQIVQIYENFTRKIEINKKTNETLEKIAKTLFKSWFIDFDPVKAKSENLSTGLSDDISNFFPDSFENSELGKIPSTWQIKRITDICEKINDKSHDKREWEEEKLIDLGRMPSNSVSLYSYGKGKELETSICNFQKYDFLFGSIRPYFYKAGIAPFNGVTNTSIFILRSKNKNLREFLYCLASSKSIFEKSVQFSKGTKMPIISWKDFSKFSFLVSDNKVIELFSKINAPIFEKILNNIHENASLEKLRNIILPKLISRQIRISNIEKIIEEVII